MECHKARVSSRNVEGQSYRGVQGCFEYDLRALEIPYLFYFGLETLPARSRYGYLKSNRCHAFE